MPATSSRASIKLYNVEGIARLMGNTARDNSGVTLIEDECTDDPMPCDICGKEIWTGWTCLDGGEFYCARHVKIVTRA